MKRAILVVSILLIAAGAMAAQRYDLQWQYDQADEAKISGFRILYTDVNAGKSYSKSFAEPSRRSIEDIVTALGLIPSHEYRFTCRAYAGEGESPDSNEVSLTVPPWTPPVDRQPVSIEIPAPGTILIYKP